MFAAIILLYLLNQQGALADKSVFEAARESQFTTFVQKVEQAGLRASLEGQGPVTVFIPTEEAFAALPADVRARLARPQNRAELRRILSNHVVRGQVTLTSAQGQRVRLQSAGGSRVTLENFELPRFAGANVLRGDIRTKNGTVHVIDQVITTAR